MKSTHSRPVVLAMTGASGAVYAMRLLQALVEHEIPVHATISDSGAAVIRQELAVAFEPDGSRLTEALLATETLLGSKQPAAGLTEQLQRARATQRLVFHHCSDYFTPIASGSFLTSGMVICPCSGSTLSAVAHAASQNLIQRAAEVHLKERRKLIVVPRETPLSEFQLENMLRLSRAGAIVLPAAPGWYHGVHGLSDLVDFIVARILDQLAIDNHRIHRWSAGEATEPPHISMHGR